MNEMTKNRIKAIAKTPLFCRTDLLPVQYISPCENATLTRVWNFFRYYVSNSVFSQFLLFPRYGRAVWRVFRLVLAKKHEQKNASVNRVKKSCETIFRGCLKTGFAFFILAFSLLFYGCTNVNVPKTEVAPVFAQNQPAEPISMQKPTATLAKMGDNWPVTRAMAAKMLAMAYYGKNDIDTMDREITFIDTTTEQWYDRYINACVVSGLMSGGGDMFYPDENLTMQQAQILLDRIDKNNKTKMQITDENKNTPISYALWTNLYITLLEQISSPKSLFESFGIAKSDIIVLITPENNKDLKPYYMITATGTMTYAGYSMGDYIDQSIGVLRKDNEVIAILNLSSEQPTIANALVVAKSDKSITVFSGGAERTYLANMKDVPDGNLCDITIKNGNAEKIIMFPQGKGGTIKKVTDLAIELDTTLIPTHPEFKIYDLSGKTAKWKGLSSLIVGTDIAEFVVENGLARGAIVRKSAKPNNIRVALSTSGFNGYIHESVSLTATTDFTVLTENELKHFKAGEQVAFNPLENTDLFGSHRLIVKTIDPNGKIVIGNIKRNWSSGESPQYRGVIEIGKEATGYTIVNELPLEQYLYAVVPSEMPTSHGLEAAKVQAITARSYAHNQFFANRYHRFGANVDDSVLCQVYNNIPENQNAIAAVEATLGKCLAYHGSIISANFFSTSSGVTANAGEVWANSTTKQFPTVSAAYLRSVKQFSEGDYGDLSKEENAAKFFRNLDVVSYDSSFAWFRWNVTMTAQELTASINKNLASRYQANPKLITTRYEQANGEVYRSRPISTIGELEDMEVLSRGQGGNILALKLVGSEATIIVETEYNIRMLLKPMQFLAGEKDILTNRNNTTPVANYTIMPSAFFTFEKGQDVAGKLTYITFFGGGNGHGVGMSQNGVKGMIDAGFTAEQILLHYYSGTEIISN